MQQWLPIAKSSQNLCCLPGLANRHALISSATRTGKTVTLQVVVERFSAIAEGVVKSTVRAIGSEAGRR
jgi:DNA double-strand break repair helicase HerA and related ATPase